MTAPAIVQLVAALNPSDAVSDFARDLRDAARRSGFASRLVAARTHPSCTREATLAAGSPPQRVASASDVLLYHHSIGAGLVDWVAGFPGRKIVVHHSITPPRFFESWSPGLESASRRGLVELSELAKVTPLAMGVSEFDGAEARAAGFAEVGLLPIAPSRRRLAARPSARFMRRLRAEPGPRMLVVGRLAPNKRVEVLLAAHALITRAVPSARLHIVGSDGGTEGYGLALRLVVREVGAPNVVFHGMVDDRRLAALFRSASIVLSASEHEGCGLPLLEAMHHGVPVIARAAAAVPETVGDAAVLVDTAEPEAWARAVQAVLTDASLRQRLVSAGKRRAEERSRIDLAARLTELVG